MKLFRRFTVLIIVACGVYLCYFNLFAEEGSVKKKEQGVYQAEYWDPLIAESINQKDISVYLNGTEVNSLGSSLYVDTNRTLMAPAAFLKEIFNCSILQQQDQKIVAAKDDIIVTFELNSKIADVNGENRKIPASAREEAEQIYLPLETLASAMNYQYQWDAEENQAQITGETAAIDSLPLVYDYREQGRQPKVKDQGSLGTCWAFASLTAVESAALPLNEYELAVDHMSIRNSFGFAQDDGGEYTMSTAYLVNWQGPVAEVEDTYGDGTSPEGLEAITHIQEAQMMEEKDYPAIKKAIYKYGGVQTSIYNSLQNSYSRSKEYNASNNAYCYLGEELPNHEVVIIGWDDTYPKENFNGDVAEDGAFICQNSWGTVFGDNGVCYISYSDTNIGKNSVVYSKLEKTDNYDNIYQADLCGWTGQLGYNEETAFFANAYTAKQQEQISAVGFYAVSKDTEYEVSIVKNFESSDSLITKTQAAKGRLNNKGYYTIPLDQAVEVAAGEKYAVVIEVKSPGNQYPVAVEFAGEGVLKAVDLSDGEGYISADGVRWEQTEEKYQCNICLKAYTKNVE